MVNEMESLAPLDLSLLHDCFDALYGSIDIVLDLLTSVKQKKYKRRVVTHVFLFA